MHTLSREELNELLEPNIPENIKNQLFLVFCNTWIDIKYQKEIIDIVNRCYNEDPSSNLFPVTPINGE